MKGVIRVKEVEILIEKFKDFINSSGYDSYEVAKLCAQILSENNINGNGSCHYYGVKLFDK